MHRGIQMQNLLTYLFQIGLEANATGWEMLNSWRVKFIEPNEEKLVGCYR